MEKGKKASLSQIECFQWTEMDSETFKLLFYDKKGQHHEKLLPKTVLEQSLRLFDGKSHLIKRSSGAFSPATPSQLLVFHDGSSSVSSLIDQNSLKISAKFVDFARDQSGLICSNKLVVHLKIVAPEAFRVMTDKHDPYRHQYWLDLGPNIVPVTVFDFYRDEKEIIKALFVKTEHLKAIANQPRGKKQQIIIYSAPESVLRVSLPEEAERVIEQHTSSRVLAKPSINLDVPEFLQYGPAQLIPTGAPIDVLTHYLRVCHDPHSQSIRKSFLNALEKPLRDTQSHLMPFGIFERA